MQFIHKLTASDTSKTAKITKRAAGRLFQMVAAETAVSGADDS